MLDDLGNPLNVPQKKAGNTKIKTEKEQNNAPRNKSKERFVLLLVIGVLTVVLVGVVGYRFWQASNTGNLKVKDFAYTFTSSVILPEEQGSTELHLKFTNFKEGNELISFQYTLINLGATGKDTTHLAGNGEIHSGKATCKLFMPTNANLSKKQLKIAQMICNQEAIVKQISKQDINLQTPAWTFHNLTNER
jgi:hypothetical protein